METLVLDADSPLVEIVSANPSMRWRIIIGGVEYSTTGGKQWRRAELKPPGEVTIGHSPSPAVLWLVGPNGAIYLTTNGSTFTRVPFSETADLVSVEAVNDREAAVTTIDGRTFRTTDRGVNWVRISQ